MCFDLRVGEWRRYSKKRQKLYNLDQCLRLFSRNTEIGGNCKISAMNSKQITLSSS